MKVRLTNGDVVLFDCRSDKIIGTDLYTQIIDDDGVVDWVYVGEILEVEEL